MSPRPQHKKVRLTAADHTFNIIVNVFMVVILIAIIFPLWSTVTLSFRPVDFIGTNLDGMFLPPWKWSTAAYEALLGNNGFLLAFVNSFKILIGGVFCALVLTIPMAYVLSVQSLPGKKIINMIVIIPYVFNVGMIPAYLLVKDIGLINHLPAVFLPGAISTYNCIIMRQFFVGIPGELKESARIDGCGELRILGQIVTPMAKAAFSSLIVFTFVSTWNDYLAPLIYISSDKLKTIQLGIRFFQQATSTDNNLLMAATCMGLVPVLIIYFICQRQFIEGIASSGVKG